MYKGFGVIKLTENQKNVLKAFDSFNECVLVHQAVSKLMSPQEAQTALRGLIYIRLVQNRVPYRLSRRGIVAKQEIENES
jgi:hypothetical protein